MTDEELCKLAQTTIASARYDHADGTEWDEAQIEVLPEVRFARAFLRARSEADAWRKILDSVDGEALRVAICKTCPSNECQIRERCTSAGTCHRNLYALAEARRP